MAARERIGVEWTSTGKNRVIGDADDVSQSLDNVSRKAEGSGASFLNAKTAIQGAMAGAAVATAVEFAKMGVELDLLDNRVSTVFGSAAGDVREWADNVNTDIGSSAERVAGMAASLGDLLVPMGATRDQAADMSTKAVELASALDLWSNATNSTEEALQKINAAMVGERDGLKALGIVIDQARIDSLLLSAGFQDLKGDARRLAEAQVVLEEIMRQSGDAIAFANSEASDGQTAVRELEANWQTLKDELAIGFAPVARETIGFLAGAAEGANIVGDALFGLPAKFQPGIAAMENATTAARNLGNAAVTAWQQVINLSTQQIPVYSPPQTPALTPAPDLDIPSRFTGTTTSLRGTDFDLAWQIEQLPPHGTGHTVEWSGTGGGTWGTLAPEPYVQQWGGPRAMGGLTPASRGGSLIRAGEAGEDEYTIPMARLHGLYGTGGDTTINVTINAAGANADDIVREIERWQRRNTNTRRYADNLS